MEVKKNYLVSYIGPVQRRNSTIFSMLCTHCYKKLKQGHDYELLHILSERKNNKLQQNLSFGSKNLLHHTLGQFKIEKVRFVLPLSVHVQLNTVYSSFQLKK